MRKQKNERGGVLVWSVIMMTGVLAIMSLGIEMFRVASALSQQRDSAQFAAEAALSDLRACLSANWPKDLCVARAGKIATAVIRINKLVGVTLANSAVTVTPEFYNCCQGSGCPAISNTDITNNAATYDGCATNTSGMCVMNVTNDPAKLSLNQTRMVRVKLTGGAFDSIFNIVGRFTFNFTKGEGTAFFKYANPSAGQGAKINYISFDRAGTC